MIKYDSIIGGNILKTLERIGIVLIINMILGIPTVIIQSQDDIPRISDRITILQVDDQYRGFDDPIILRKRQQFEEIEMSLSGRYVVGRTRVTEESGRLVLSNLHIWDTYEFDFNSNVIFPEPHTSLPLDDTTYTKDFAISPDDRYLALRTDTTLRLLTLPDLTLVNEIPASRTVSGEYVIAYAPNDKIAWSHDGSILVALIENETSVLFWEIESGKVSIIPLNVMPYPDWQRTPTTKITSTQQGWIIRDFYEQPDIAFVFCNTEEACTTYKMEDVFNTENKRYSTKTVITALGTLFITEVDLSVDGQRDPNDGQLVFWQFMNGIYGQVKNLPKSIYPYCPRQVSPTASYLYYHNCLDYQKKILDLETMTIERSIEFKPAWISDDTYLATLDTELVFHLERVDSEGDFDFIDFTNVSEIDQNELIYNDVTIIQSVTDNGKQVLITLGGVAALIYIEYE